MSRTVEKVLAWISNIILIFITIVFSIIGFSSSFLDFLKIPEFKTSFEQELGKQGQLDAFNNLKADDIISLVQTFLKVIPIILIILVIIALVATFSIKKRVFSGVLFLVLAVLIALITFLSAFILYLPYLVVAIMLFVRKDTTQNKDDIENTEEIERIEYV